MVLIMVACGGGGSFPTVSDARIGQPTGPNAALYFTASGYGDADKLISASTEVAPTLELHETIMGEGGTMSMSLVQSLDLPADGQLVLEPGGYHIMLVGVDTLELGSTVEVTLTWEKAGSQRIQAIVVSPADTMSGE
jgi:hypothetical protein